MTLASQIILVVCVNLFSAFIQASIGFGYALIVMPLMALFLPMATCSAISAVTIVAIGIQMSVTLRKSLKIATVVLPMLCCFATINVGLYLLATFDEFLLRIVLAFLLIVATMSSIMVNKAKGGTASGKWYFAVIAGLLTGVSAGMFNIVGPFLLLYYFTVCDDTLHIKASLEFSFLLAGIYSSIMHYFIYRNINAAVAPLILAAVAAALVAGFVGIGIYRRLNKKRLASFVYVLLPVMALILVLNGIMK